MYDLGIIGSGPAGYVAAERAGSRGLSVALIEKDDLGGVCLNTGCIPTKTLLYSAKLYNLTKEARHYGVNIKEVTFDLRRAMIRKNKIVKVLCSGIESMMKKNKVDVIKGAASIMGLEVDHTKIAVNDEVLECRNVLIATGSEPVIPEIEGFDQRSVLTSKEILELREPPQDLVIVGGGFIGLEFASFFNSIGTKISVIEMMDEIAPGMDKEISGMLRKELKKKGINFYLESQVTKMDNGYVVFEKNGEEDKVKAEKILLSVGRRATTYGFGLENLGVEIDEKGIRIDRRCRTNVPSIYAAGDVTGFSLLAHTASREGEVVVNTIMGKSDVMRYAAVPAVIYTDPEVACVGYTEDDAKRAGKKYTVLSLPMAYSARFKAENDRKNGLCKIIVGREKGEVLGVHMIGGPCSETIYGASIMIETEMTADDIKEIIFPHPTVSEIIKDTMCTFKPFKYIDIQIS